MKYPAVYSYKHVNTRELELSIASLRNIDCWNGDIYIVGDPPQIKTKAIHLPIQYSWGRQSRNRHNDEICAYLTARNDIGDFIAMADDIFCLKPWELQRHNRGELQAHIDGRRSDSYSTRLLRTKEFLEAHSKPTLSYELHIPFLMKAEELTAIEDLLPHDRTGVLIRSILGNWFNTPSTYADDTKNKQLDSTTVLYSSSDSTFDYERVSEWLL